MSDTPTRLSRKPTYLTTQLATHAHRLAAEAFAAAGARSYHYRILAALEQFGPQSQADLGRKVHIDRSDVAAAVGQLVELGQVERRSDPSDARRWIIYLTAAGRRQLRRLDKELEISQERFLEPLDPTERTEYARVLSLLLDHHNADG